MSTVPGLFAAGECAAGINGANRLGGNSLSDLLVFGKRAGEHAALFAKKNGAGRVDDGAENPYRIQQELQEMMQDLVGIVRREGEMKGALEGLAKLRERGKRVKVPGTREFNPGWHTALDLPNLFTVSEAVARCAIERKESRGAHFREDFPDKDPAWGKMNLVVRKTGDGAMQVDRVPLAEMPAELAQVIEEMK